MNGDTFQIIALKFLLIVSVAEAADMVKVHALTEDLELDCYISAFFCSEHGWNDYKLIDTPRYLFDVKCMQ